MISGPNVSAAWLETAVLDALTDAVVIHRPDGMILAANRAARRLFGDDCTDVSRPLIDPSWQLFAENGTPWAEGLHPGLVTVATGCSVSAALMGVVTGEGRRLWLSVSATNLHDDDGVDAGVVVVYADVTDRTETLANLAAIEGSYQRLVDQSLDLITRHALNGEMTWASPAALDLLGRDPSELVGRQPRDFCHPDDVGSLRDGTAAAIRSGGDATMIWRAVLPNGSHRWMESKAHTVTDPHTGEPVEVLGFTRDITARRQAEEALLTSEERFRTAFEASPIGMSLVDLSGKLLQVNPAACEMTGYSAEEMRAMGAWQLTHPDDWPKAVTVALELLDGSRDRAVLEKRYVRANGEVRWDQVHLTVIGSRDGQPSQLLLQALDVTERREIDGRLRYLVDHDPLTGLINRYRFERELDAHQRRVAEEGAAGALLVLDLDHFKYVNDSLGHHAGDQLIMGIATVLEDTAEASTVVARLGGDEFAVLLASGGAAEAEAMAARLIDAVRTTTVQLRGGSRRRVTTSVGIALFGGTAASADDMLVAADLAMYDAKEDGRNRYAFACNGEGDENVFGRARTRTRVSWVERIEHALEHDRFELYAQPILDLRSGEVDQFELLLRMREADGSLTLPGDFLAVAERLDLIQGIDRWVTSRAIDLLADNQRVGRDICLEVNLSGRSLNDPGLLDLISTRIRTSMINPSRLIFEITETAAVADISAARAFAHDLADLGCRFALDDFGAGFGSFYYLKYLPFDYLKIDGEFVAACTSNPTDQTIIRALVDIARQLGKQTVAEFTQDAATLRFLRREGVDHAQGFHVGRPMPLSRALGPAPLPLGSRAV